VTIGRWFRPAALALAILAGAPADADEVRFDGQTGADAALLHDAIQEVLRFSAMALHCDKLTAVQASMLAESWSPREPNFRIGPPGTRYERWWVTLCGRMEPFLVGFWRESGGGAQFQVAYPFPADLPAAPR
jgi:hypothetical protein